MSFRAVSSNCVLMSRPPSTRAFLHSCRQWRRIQYIPIPFGLLLLLTDETDRVLWSSTRYPPRTLAISYDHANSGPKPCPMRAHERNVAARAVYAWKQVRHVRPSRGLTPDDCDRN